MSSGWDGDGGWSWEGEAAARRVVVTVADGVGTDVADDGGPLTAEGRAAALEKALHGLWLATWRQSRSHATENDGAELAEAATRAGQRARWMEDAAAMAAERAVLGIDLAIPCVRCGHPVEFPRRCYAHPTRYKCLPPPEPLPELRFADCYARHPDGFECSRLGPHEEHIALDANNNVRAKWMNEAPEGGPCPGCNGTGGSFAGEGALECGACGGSGELPSAKPADGGHVGATPAARRVERAAMGIAEPMSRDELLAVRQVERGPAHARRHESLDLHVFGADSGEESVEKRII